MSGLKLSQMILCVRARAYACVAKYVAIGVYVTY